MLALLPIVTLVELLELCSHHGIVDLAVISIFITISLKKGYIFFRPFVTFDSYCAVVETFQLRFEIVR